MFFHHIALNIPLGLMTYAHTSLIEVGTRVSVPFRGKTMIGIVWANQIQPDIDIKKIRFILNVFENEPKLPENWRFLCSFAARYYHYPIGQTVFAALMPAGRENKAIVPPTLPRLVRLNTEGHKQTPPSPRATRQTELWSLLKTQWQDETHLKQIHPSYRKLLNLWHENAWLDYADATLPLSIPAAQHTLNPQQSQAAQHIIAALGSFSPFLLYGITGSGKTEVYFDCIAKVLNAGQQVLFLLPEIGLTPQLLQRIQKRFGDIPTAVLHSQTSATIRSRDYLRAMLGQARLIIGTRLAVFTPLPHLGLIVVDEEHDSSFKQDSELRYHARDLAIWRAKQASCPIVLGSATPSLESWHKAQKGIFRLLELTQRAHPDAVLPTISLLDIRRTPLHQGLSPTVLDLLKNNFRQGGMSLVYLNRRGFSPALFCSECGHTFACPHCSAKMVLHQRAKQLRCHHCNHRIAVPHHCTDCGNQDLSAVGYGTQRVEDALRLALPQAKIARVDRDTISNKNDWAAFYQEMEQQQIDVLIGTQMLAKGHDFARLNLVIVVNADGSLYSSDFRACERLFAELMQVAGRAGRADHAGNVVIQTQLPEHSVFQNLIVHDFPQFAAQELQERELFSLPPFGFQAAIRADAVQANEALALLERIKHDISPHLPENVQQLGPAPMLMTRLAGRERVQLFLESSHRNALHQAIALWEHALLLESKNAIRWHIDVDVQEM